MKNLHSNSERFAGGVCKKVDAIILVLGVPGTA